MLLLAALLAARAAAEPDTVEKRATKAVRALAGAASFSTSRVDHACASREKRGKDPCACQLGCKDLQCSNARQACGADFRAWCARRRGRSRLDARGKAAQFIDSARFLDPRHASTRHASARVEECNCTWPQARTWT